MIQKIIFIDNSSFLEEALKPEIDPVIHDTGLEHINFTNALEFIYEVTLNPCLLNSTFCIFISQYLPIISLRELTHFLDLNEYNGKIIYVYSKNQKMDYEQFKDIVIPLNLSKTDELKNFKEGFIHGQKAA